MESVWSEVHAAPNQEKDHQHKTEFTRHQNAQLSQTRVSIFSKTKRKKNLKKNFWVFKNLEKQYYEEKNFMK